jgi:hypothetical protein
MAAFVVMPWSDVEGMPHTGTRLSIFPGAATPSVFAAGEPFWIGYGFVPEPGAEDAESDTFESATRFELDVDGEPMAMATDVTSGDGGRPLSKHSFATFETGLPAGWHRFSGRWYDQGRLVLSTAASIQFVER